MKTFACIVLGVAIFWAMALVTYSVVLEVSYKPCQAAYLAGVDKSGNEIVKCIN